MQHEAEQESNAKCRRSPLAGIDNDYRRSLKKLLGITYSELRQAAKAEHWAVVWDEDVEEEISRNEVINFQIRRITNVTIFRQLFYGKRTDDALAFNLQHRHSVPANT